VNIHYTLVGLLLVAFLMPTLSEAGRTSIRTRGVYSNANSESSVVSEIAIASCGENEAATGGGCACDGPDTDFDKTNLGFVDNCIPAGDGKSFIGYCFANPLAYDPKLLGPGITVVVHCAVRARIVRSTADDPLGESRIQTPADQMTENDLSLEALQMKRKLERQTQIFSERMQRNNTRTAE